MEKIFYADSAAFPSSVTAVEYALKKHFGISDGKIVKTENGKPYLENYTRLFFSISHTRSKLFIAFSSDNVGIDAEEIGRECNLSLLLRKLPEIERREIATQQDFLTHWTVKESAIKWLGGTIAHDLKSLVFVKGVLTYGEIEIPVKITTKQVEKHILSLCSERDFAFVEPIPLYHE